MARLACAVVLLAAIATVAAAYRPPPQQWLQENFPFPTSWRHSAATAGSPFAKAGAAVDRKGGERAYHAVKYYVEPELHRDFIDAWNDLEDSVRDEEEGNKIYTLQKTAEDDVVFLSYGEWKSYEDWFDHVKSKHVEKFAKRLQEWDIPFTITPLYEPHNAGQLHRKSDEGDEEDNSKRRLAHALVRYYAPPSAHDDLVDAWHEALEGASDEKGIRVYALRKSLHDNVEFTSYGAWDSVEALQDHFESDHVDKLRDRLAKLKVYWRITILKNVQEGHKE